METKTNDGFMSASVSKKFQSQLDLLKHKSDWNDNYVEKVCIKIP